MKNEEQREMYFVILFPLISATCKVIKRHGSLLTTHVFCPSSP